MKLGYNIDIKYFLYRHREGEKHVDDGRLPKNQTVLSGAGVRVPGGGHALGGEERERGRAQRHGDVFAGGAAVSEALHRA